MFIKTTSNKIIKREIIVNWFATVINFLVPFIIFPFASRVFSKGNFQDYLYFLTLTSFFTLLCDYGFNISSTRKIARAKQPLQINEIATKTLVLKVMLLFISGFIIAYLVRERTIFEIFILILNLSVNTLQPTWFFLGITKNSINVFSLAFGKALSLICIYFFISNNSSFLILMSFNILGGIVSLLLAWGYLFTYEKFRITCFSIFELLHVLKEDFYVSIATIAISGYTTLPAIILGRISGNYYLSEYVSVEKIFKSIEYLLTAPLTIIFPLISNDFSLDKSYAQKKIIKATQFVFITGMFIITIAILFGNNLFQIYYGEKYIVNHSLIIVLSCIPIVGGLAVSWGNLGLANLSGDKYFFLIILFGSVLNIVLSFVLSFFFRSIGAAISLVISTSVIALLMRYFYLKNLTKN